MDPDIPAESMYREHILDHYEHPRNFRRMKHPDASSFGTNPLCGDEIRLELQVKDGKIIDIAFQGGGCAISKASASLITEGIKGKSLVEVKKMTKDDVLGLLAIPISPVRLKCALLSLQVLEHAITKYEEKHGRDHHH